MTSDDQWLDLFAIQHLIGTLFVSKSSIYCPVIRNEPIDRSSRGMFSVTKDDWPAHDDDIFPDFCSDMLYIMSVDTAAMIVESASHADQVLGTLDSVWVTGVLTPGLYIDLVDISHLWTLSPPLLVLTKVTYSNNLIKLHNKSIIKLK